MSKSHLDNVRFDFIRYANCWEDADVLLKGLQLDKTSTVMSIASAGDNCFALLSQQPKKVIGIDISPVQLFLVELKKVAIAHFERTVFLEFAGFTPSENRPELYHSIKNDLSAACMAYWDANLSLIEKGLIHQGKFEQYFQLFKKEVLPTVHDRAIIDKLFEPKTAAAQRTFHDNEWHTPEWETMYGQFFGEEMMGTQGRDPEFLKHAEGTVPDIILQREMAHLRTVKAQKNYFLYYILYNEFPAGFLPYYVRPENYHRVKTNLDRLELYNGLLDSALDQHSECTHFNLSDIFEYMDKTLFRTTAKDLITRSAPNAKFAYWNLLIPRYLSTEYPEQLKHNKTLSAALKQEDPGYFYGDFIIETKK